MQEKVNALVVSQQWIQELEGTVIELKNRNRRNNNRMYGLPEGVEKNEPARFLEQWLPRALTLQLYGPLEIQRAHRLPTSQSPGSTSPPRPIIA